MHDVAIVGGGPAGATCATFCAERGLRTLLLEREKFPRDKVCGDCLNPSCWPLLRRLKVEEPVRAQPHGRLDRVEFIGIDGRTFEIALPQNDEAEIAIKRSLLDELLMMRAKDVGTEVHEKSIVTALERSSNGWKITANAHDFEARVLVAADGRNSTVARLCHLLPRIAKERIALQTHVPLPVGFGNRVVLQILPEGYSGQAPVNDAELNLCLVGKARDMPALRRWAEARFQISPEHPWRTITPLTRAPLSVGGETLFLIGDAARVVEPFTGEGIYYALRSGELAAGAIAEIIRGKDRQSTLREFARAHSAMYRGRLWINQLARAAVLSPRIASLFASAARFQPSILRLLTARIVQPL